MTILGIFAFQVENFPAMQFYVFGMPIFVHIPQTVPPYFPWTVEFLGSQRTARIKFGMR